MSNLQLGANLDYRTDDEKAKDFLHEEAFAAAATPPVWVEKTEFKRYTPRNQDGSLSCVANGGGIMLEAHERNETGKFIQFSSKDIYARRANKPYGGMSLHDVLKILCEGGAYETQVPSMNIGESAINQPYTVTPDIALARATHASDYYLEIKTKTSDAVAQVLDMNIPVIAFWYFSEAQAYSEWWRQVPAIYNFDLKLEAENGTLRHQAIIIDRTLVSGKRYLVVQDSAGVGSGMDVTGDIRLVPEDFFLKRNYGLGYTIDKKNLAHSEPTFPAYHFSRTLKVGSTGDDVQALQKILVYEKCMVIGSPTKLFAGMTRAGVIKFQEKYAAEILAPLGLKKGTGIVGAMTLKKLNSLK